MGDFPRSGVHPELEEEANRIIRESLRGVTARSAKADILTPWKEQDRKSREVYNATGVADPSSRRGMFHRSWNPSRPDLNSVDGPGPRARRVPRINYLDSDRPWPTGAPSAMERFVAENLRGEDRDGAPIPLSFGEPE